MRIFRKGLAVLLCSVVLVNLIYRYVINNKLIQKDSFAEETLSYGRLVITEEDDYVIDSKQHRDNNVIIPVHDHVSNDVIKQAAQDEIKKHAIVSNECKVVLNGEVNEVKKLRNVTKNVSGDVTNGFYLNDVTSDEEVLKAAENCTALIEKYGFLATPDSKYYVTDEERQFPIAYSILGHENSHQIALLLSAIYRTQNIHCVHLDIKASKATYKAVVALTNCFTNVFVSTKRINVIYATVSRLQADLACMEDLINVPSTMFNWKYLINLCSQDFPLRTNLEIVKQLKEFRRRNSIGGYADPGPAVLARTKFIHKLQNITSNGKTELKLINTNQLHSPPPYNMTVRKNLAYNFFTREFLQWVLHDSKEGKALLDWSMDTYSPDEHYWLMLHTYPGAPGGSNLMSGFQLARMILWSFTNQLYACYGAWRHYICVFGAENIRNLTTRREIFVNKMDVKLDSTGVRCLREWITERIYIPNEERKSWNPDRAPFTPSPTFFV